MFLKFRHGDTLCLQLASYRAGDFPFAHSQPATCAVVESISTMLLLSGALPLCIAVFSLACLVLLLKPSLFLSLFLFVYLAPLSLRFSIPMSLWASPGLVAVGSTRASHTVTWHAIYRPSRGWLSEQGGCCLKQRSLNKRGRSSQGALRFLGFFWHPVPPHYSHCCFTLLLR